MVFQCNLGFPVCIFPSLHLPTICFQGDLLMLSPPLLRMRPAWCRCLSFHGAWRPFPKLKNRPKKISSHSSQNLKFYSQKGEPFFRQSCKNKSRRRVNPIHDIVAPTSSDGYNFVTLDTFGGGRPKLDNCLSEYIEKMNDLVCSRTASIISEDFYCL